MLACLCGAMAILCVVWVVIFSLMCVLLHWTNVDAVHTACGGFWEFMLVATVVPPILPCLTICSRGHSGGSLLVLALAGLWMTSTASAHGECVAALRAATPPVPWLIVMGWLYAVLYGAGGASVLTQ